MKRFYFPHEHSGVGTIPTVIHPGCFMASGTATVGGERYGCRIADRIFPQSIRSTAFRQPYAFAFFRKFINYVDT